MDEPLHPAPDRRPWGVDEPGVLRLPSGRLVRGRGVRGGEPPEHPPTFALYLLGEPPDPQPWTTRWVRWRDWWVPADRQDAYAALADTWRRLDTDRVEVACGGGRGRTGTALSCLAVLDGLPPGAAVRHVRRHYHRRAVETPWQRRFVGWFATRAGEGG